MCFSIHDHLPLYYTENSYYVLWPLGFLDFLKERSPKIKDHKSWPLCWNLVNWLSAKFMAPWSSGQDVAFSARNRGFDSLWGYKRFHRLSLVFKNAGVKPFLFFSFHQISRDFKQNNTKLTHKNIAGMLLGTAFMPFFIWEIYIKGTQKQSIIRKVLIKLCYVLTSHFVRFIIHT